MKISHWCTSFHETPNITTGNFGKHSQWCVHSSRHNIWVNTLRTQNCDRESQLMGLLSLSKILLGGRLSCEILIPTALWCWLSEDSQGTICASMIRYFILWHTPVLHSTAQHKMVTKKDSTSGPKGIVWFHKSPKKWEQIQDPGAILSTNCLGSASETHFRSKALFSWEEPSHGLNSCQEQGTVGFSERYPFSK